MNPDSVFLVDRPFQDIVDDILTAVIGGVVNEEIIFDLRQDRYPLTRPALDIRGITGTVLDTDGEPGRYTFQKPVDFVYDQPGNVVVWQDGGRRPADLSTFYVDYALPPDDRPSPITDINVGSVTRTLAEAVGREIATVYEQINLAYRAGFLDTATGTALDLVVAILGIARKPRQLAVGLVTFFRAAGIDGSITIPAGTVVTTAAAKARFATSEQRTLQRGQARIDVPVRAEAAFAGDAGTVPAGAVTDMLAPIAGISRVTNIDPTILSAEGETDEQLRARAKAVLRSLGQATLPALTRVISEGGGRPVEVWEGENPGPTKAPLGTVTILVEAEPERMPSLRAAVHETRAAGVQAALVARYVFFTPRLAVVVRPGLTAQGREKIVTSMIARVQAYVDTLTSGDRAEGRLLLDAAATNPAGGRDPDIVSVRAADVITWRPDLGGPGAEPLTDAVLTALAGLPATADETVRRAAVEAAVGATVPALPPTGRRIPDHGLLRAADGSPVTDEQIDSGDFVVDPTVGDESFWVVLDMQPSDVAVRTQGE
ncbi:baseplate J/gp47 family protein [Frankia sp. CiP1_Cm_nod2]|uniref:baseplate J/gp47 family protein n=1 Tax=Frankia sp. CiP1_Cm_nod2 TaxID=2897161 RepID=UPI002023EA72